MKETAYSNRHRYNVNLARLTSWRVGGSAEAFFSPDSIQDLSAFLTQCDKAEPLFFLGLGSNTLIRDGGIAGTTISLHPSGCQVMELVDAHTVRVESGVPCAKFSRFCARSGLTGMAFLAGVPGTMGGALKMNAGANGGETWDHVVAVETVDRQGRLRVRQASDFNVAYRHVEGQPDEYFVAGIFSLMPGTKEKGLQTIKDCLARRQQAQPINLPSGGSVFRNPPGDHAWRLIQASGLAGHYVGGARVSEKHANFIVHDGEASALDIETLINTIMTTVHEKTGVHLIREVKIVGRHEV